MPQNYQSESSVIHSYKTWFKLISKVLVWRPICNYFWCYAVSGTCLHQRYLLLRMIYSEEHLHSGKLIVQMASCIAEENILGNDPVSRMLREGWIEEEEDVISHFWCGYFSIDCAWANYHSNPSLVQTQCIRGAQSCWRSMSCVC